MGKIYSLNICTHLYLDSISILSLFSQEKEVLNKLFEKYVHGSIDMIVDGIVDGKQGQKLKTVVPQTDLNMVGSCRCS